MCDVDLDVLGAEQDTRVLLALADLYLFIYSRYIMLIPVIPHRHPYCIIDKDHTFSFSSVYR